MGAKTLSWFFRSIVELSEEASLNSQTLKSGFFTLFCYHVQIAYSIILFGKVYSITELVIFSIVVSDGGTLSLNALRYRYV